MITAPLLGDRRPVWLALAELYLDTDTRPELPAIALTLVRSGLSEAELNVVWQHEVTPLRRALHRLQAEETEQSFQTALTLSRELQALPEADRLHRAGVWTWFARAYFWPESPPFTPVPDTPTAEAQFVALEPHLRRRLSGKESAAHQCQSVLKLIRRSS